MKKFNVYGKVVGTKYLGKFTTNNKQEAINKAEKISSVSLCHQCSKECEDPEIIDIFAEEAK